MDDRILKAVDVSTGKGFPEKPEPVTEGSQAIRPEDRGTSPQTMSLAQAAQKNYIKLVQNPSTGNTNYVINHGRLHSNGYRLLKEGQEVRSRVISAKNEKLYSLEADPKLIGSAPETVKEDFAADPSNPQAKDQVTGRSALDEAKAYVQDLVDQGLLGEKIDQKSLENYAQAIAGMLPVQSDGTNPNDITVELLRKKLEENAGTEIASALFNVDPDDPSHVDIDKFVAQIRKKRTVEEQTTGKAKEKTVPDKATLEKIAKEVLPPGFSIYGIENPQSFRGRKQTFALNKQLQTYESIGHGFIQRMLAVQFKYLGIPVSNVQDFLQAASAKDSVGNFTHFEFVKNCFLKLGYNSTDAGKKTEYYLNLISRTDSSVFYVLSASGLNISTLASINLYKTLDGSVNADNLYAQSAAVSIEGETAEDPQQVEREKVVALKEAVHKQYLTDEEMEYGILHILQKPIGYKHLTLDMDRVESLEDHIAKKTILALKNDGLVDIFFAELAKIENISTDELSGRFDIQPSTIKNLDIALEEAKNRLFDIIKSTATGVKVDPEKHAEHMARLYVAKINVQVLQDLKALGMKTTNFDKEKIKELIEIRKKDKLSSKARGLLDWANGDIEPTKDYPMITDSGIAERQQQLATVFAKPGDFRNAGYEKIKELHKQMFMGNLGATPGSEKPEQTARNDELSAEISNAVEGSLQGKDLNVLKVSKDIIYEINNSYIEMLQIKENQSELEIKRNALEKFLSSRGLSPAGAKSASDAVLSVIKGDHTGGLPVDSGSKRPTTVVADNTPVPNIPAETTPSIDKILQRLQAKGIKKIPKAAQGNLDRLKAYLEVNDITLAENEIQMLFKHFNPAPPQFSFEEYARKNPERFIEKGGKFYIRFNGKDIPVPENIKASEKDLMSFIKEQDEKEVQIQQQKLQQTSEKVKEVISRIDTIGKLKKLNKKELVQQLAEAGMSEAEASLMIEQLIKEKLPALQAKVQAKIKGLENSAKVRSIFTSDGKSLTADEISTNISGLSAAVLSEISDYFIDDKEALEAAEKIVLSKYQQAVQAEKIFKIDEQLGIKPKEGKSGNSGELDLVINGNPTKIKVKKTDDGYILTSSEGAEIQLSQKELLNAGQVNYEVLAQQIEAATPLKEVKKPEGKQNAEAVDDGSIPVEVKKGKLANVAELALNITGAILSGRPIKLSAPITRLDEKSWFDLVDAISRSKAFKKLKLPSEAAEDIVFQLTSAPDDQLDFDLSKILRQATSKSIFSLWQEFITKNMTHVQLDGADETSELESDDEYYEEDGIEDAQQFPVQTVSQPVQSDLQAQSLPSAEQQSNVSVQQPIDPKLAAQQQPGTIPIIQEPVTPIQPIPAVTVPDGSTETPSAPKKRKPRAKKEKVEEPPKPPEPGVMEQVSSVLGEPYGPEKDAAVIKSVDDLYSRIGDIDAAPPEAITQELERIPEIADRYKSVQFFSSAPLVAATSGFMMPNFGGKQTDPAIVDAVVKRRLPLFSKALALGSSGLMGQLMKANPIKGISFGFIPTSVFGPHAKYDPAGVAMQILEDTERTGGIYSPDEKIIHISPLLQFANPEELKRAFSPIEKIGTYDATVTAASGTFGVETPEQYVSAVLHHEAAHYFQDLIEADKKEDPEAWWISRDIENAFLESKKRTAKLLKMHEVLPDDTADRFHRIPEIPVGTIVSLMDEVVKKVKEATGEGSVKIPGSITLYGLTSASEWFAEHFGVYMRNPEAIEKWDPKVASLMKKAALKLAKRGKAKQEVPPQPQ